MLKAQQQTGVQCYPTAIAILAGVPVSTVVNAAKRKYGLRWWSDLYGRHPDKQEYMLEYLARKFVPLLVPQIADWLCFKRRASKRLPSVLHGTGIIMLEWGPGHEGHAVAFANNDVFDGGMRWHRNDWKTLLEPKNLTFCVIRNR